MNHDEVTCQIDGGVAHLTINRPTSGNSLSLSTIRAITHRLTELEHHTDVAVIVLSGSGNRIFCSGHDLKEILEHDDPQFFKDLSVECSAMMQAIQQAPQIVIAAVDGVATAAGCQLVATADLAIATTRSRFATPGVNIGLWCLTPMVAISRTIAPKHAMQMLATGQLFDANFALSTGLINEAVEPEELEARVQELATTIASKSTFTLALGKRAFYRQLGMSTADAYDYTGETIVRNSMHADAQEGIQAFLEKRTPQWQGRSPAPKGKQA